MPSATATRTCPAAVAAGPEATSAARPAAGTASAMPTTAGAAGPPPDTRHGERNQQASDSAEQLRCTPGASPVQLQRAAASRACLADGAYAGTLAR